MNFVRQLQHTGDERHSNSPANETPQCLCDYFHKAVPFKSPHGQLVRRLRGLPSRLCRADLDAWASLSALDRINLPCFQRIETVAVGTINDNDPPSVSIGYHFGVRGMEYYIARQKSQRHSCRISD